MVEIWGHLWGLHIRATTAIPEAVLTGLAFNMGNKVSLYWSGIADIIYVNLGI